MKLTVFEMGPTKSTFIVRKKEQLIDTVFTENLQSEDKIQ